MVVHKINTEGPIIMLVCVCAIIVIFQLIPVMCRKSARILNGGNSYAKIPSQDVLVSSTAEDEYMYIDNH